MANKEKDFLKEFKKDFIAGSASGAAVTLATQPLDTAAVMAQAGTSEVSSNFNQNFKPAGKGAGKLKGLAKLKRMYRGTSPRLIKSTAAGAIGYPVFMAAADILDKNANLNTKGMKEHINLNPAQMKQLSHTEKDNEFRQADSMLTQDAIDHIVKKVLNRPGALGTRKEKLQYSPVQKEASWLNFARGLIGASSKGA